MGNVELLLRAVASLKYLEIDNIKNRSNIWDSVKLSPEEKEKSLNKLDYRSQLYFGSRVAKYAGPYMEILHKKLTEGSEDDLAFQKKFKALTKHPKYRQDTCLSNAETLLRYSTGREQSFASEIPEYKFRK